MFTARRPHPVLLLAGFLLAAGSIWAQYPHIELLTNRDTTFVRLQHDVAAAYRALSRDGPPPALALYTYTVQPGDTVFALAARFSIPYAALATINRLGSPDALAPGSQLLVPTVPGVFLPVAPQTELEHLMSDLRAGAGGGMTAVERDGRTELYRFFPGDDFLSDERRAFLGVLFRHPLLGARITSPFGNRIHPVTGTWGMHAGVDYGAPAGTPVRAARTGTVVRLGTDDVMGKYVLLSHPGGFETFYGHLQSPSVSLNQTVESGMIIGWVGSTGLSTGPHLHFEIRQDGAPRNPVELLPRGAQ